MRKILIALMILATAACAKAPDAANDVSVFSSWSNGLCLVGLELNKRHVTFDWDGCTAEVVFEGTEFEGSLSVHDSKSCLGGDQHWIYATNGTALELCNEGRCETYSLSDQNDCRFLIHEEY